VVDFAVIARGQTARPAIGALLVLQALSGLDTETGAHRIRGQLTHLGMDGIDLISQRTKPLPRRLTGDESAHTPTLKPPPPPNTATQD
jgi:hypothetical protein